MGLSMEAGRNVLDFTPDRTLSLSTEFAIREAIKLLADSRRHFKSCPVAEARRLLEAVLASEGRAEWPPPKSSCASENKPR